MGEVISCSGVITLRCAGKANNHEQNWGMTITRGEVAGNPLSHRLGLATKIPKNILKNLLEFLQELSKNLLENLLNL